MNQVVSKVLLLISFTLVYCFDPEDGGETFLRNSNIYVSEDSTLNKHGCEKLASTYTSILHPAAFDFQRAVNLGRRGNKKKCNQINPVYSAPFRK
jgi:hypothetical protein